MKKLKNKTILITGGTGSFGNAVIKKIINYDIKAIKIFSRDEKKQEDMRILFKDKRLKFYIGDVRDSDSIDQVMEGVDYVFHAAALKQVPSCEFYPMEAIKTNAYGAQNIMKSANQHRVKRVVLLSTDKAVYPINTMGISKALMEKLMLAKARQSGSKDTLFCTTRYGNVMGSRGSVIPLFIKQIKTGKPITITNPNMTRFFMSLEQSVNLVIHAFKYGNQGDIFVQKSNSATIGDLAQALKELFLAKNPIKIIGNRHGEKTYETLLTREEKFIASDKGLFYQVPMDSRDLNYDKYFVEGQKKISSFNDYTSDNAKKMNIGEIKKLLLKLDFIKKSLHD
ncbi:polysaccharide biosynthesis protein [Candidatus Pelagibacter ubique]|nr:polysaccharide biosynthesis protein [Candidatus Pelagibacter ubique]